SSFYKVPYFRLKETYFKSEKKISFLNTNLNLDEPIINKIKETIDKNQQVIVFLPTRANFKYQICNECGVSIECPFCSVSLSLHKNHNALQCHYCNYTQAITKTCPSCQTGTIESFRLGTAEVYDQLQNTFQDKVVEKFDRDSIKTNTILKKTLKQFNENKIDILVGTQMLSKGHDYHNVTLAVVLGIDSILNMSSYKVREKALSLLIQISGRSGRKGLGEVLIQTKNEDFFHHYLEVTDYKDFLKDELKQRVDLYPPYLKIARVIFAHKNAFIAKKELDKYVHQFANKKEVELIGFGESNIFKIANNYRYELLLRSTNIQLLLSVLHSIKSTIVSIDMDTLQ
ncbi:MAG: primosomal protein N' (replication factor Y), partial [Arcobacteraceae bacterium]